ncbi:MAG: UbiX family flavin prenyltransferase [Deltaproteobacteria bacterium]|nr:UbiX family flavin prenyltransferase [Deltaproteobacteria bacterium]MBI3076885.1 UbiX family flavin prenyltransferase [Deltaproteobacteria bacterium]
MRLVIGISGSTGSIYGIRCLEVLHGHTDVETHLVISKPAERTIEHETDWKVEDVRKLATVVYEEDDIGAAISSGSFKTAGMIVAPCSIKTLAGIANSFNDNLLTRAADVTLKERRRLVICLRETPLHLGHIEHMLKVTQMGGIMVPPIPAFYNRPKTLDDIVNHAVGRMLDLHGIEHKGLLERWKGLAQPFKR